MRQQAQTLEWRFTDQGTWLAEGDRWGYELIPNYNAKDLDGNPRELWNLRVWRLLADPDRPESKIIGGYGSAEAGKWWAQNKENDPNAIFKTAWFNPSYLKD